LAEGVSAILILGALRLSLARASRDDKDHGHAGGMLLFSRYPSMTPLPKSGDAVAPSLAAITQAVTVANSLRFDQEEPWLLLQKSSMTKRM
jgi:hypothetical protein